MYCNRVPIPDWMKVKLILNALVFCLCTSGYNPDSGRIKCFRIRQIKDQQGWQWQHGCGGEVITSSLGERTIAPLQKPYLGHKLLITSNDGFFYYSNYYSLMCESLVTFGFIITITIQLFMVFKNTTYSKVS